jgi:hypothetical protein
MLAGMMEIDGLNCAGKVVVGKFPDPNTPSPITTFRATRLQPRRQASLWSWRPHCSPDSITPT